MKLASCKSALNPTVVYSTDPSKAVVPVWSYSLLLCGLFYEAICFSFAWCYFVLVFFSPSSIGIRGRES